jgi:hypothetical protein
VLWVLASGGPSAAAARWKPYDQLARDIETVVGDGYRRICIFDLKTVRDHPDARYRELLRQTAARGVEIAVYAQEMAADRATLDLARQIGAREIIAYEKPLLELFAGAGFRITWWALIGYPSAHPELKNWEGWIDLRDRETRVELTRLALTPPLPVAGGISLDYIRWNKAGAGRSAEQVTDIVSRIHRRLTARGAGPLSAAVYPYVGKSASHGGSLSVEQEWHLWLKEGLLEFAIPMAYESEDIPRLLGEWRPYRERIVPALSVMNYRAEPAGAAR